MELAQKFLDLCLYPFKMYSNPIVLVPLGFLTVLGLFGLFKRLAK
jgi:hypothetical protein